MDQKIRLTSNEMSYISLFESLTGTVARDCIIDNKRERILFIVNPKSSGRAIGKQGSHVKMMQRMVNKNIEIVEYSDDPIEFIKKSFYPAGIKEVRITERLDNKKVAVVTVEHNDKGIAIGKDGKTAERTRLLARRYFQIDNVIIV